MNIPIQYRPKYIKGYEGEYGVCRAGYVYSFKSWRFLDGWTNRNGYKCIALYKNNKKEKYLVHRLVAQAFIPNPNNLPCINHKIDDFEHRSDNRVENIEWCDHKYNNNYGNHGKRISEAIKGRPSPNKGKQLSEKTKKKISATRKQNGLSKR